jgi:hypothetical protein
MRVLVLIRVRRLLLAMVCLVLGVVWLARILQ